jgi:hypothetical protein
VREIAAFETMKIGGAANRPRTYRTVNISALTYGVLISPNRGNWAMVVLPWRVIRLARPSCGR